MNTYNAFVYSRGHRLPQFPCLGTQRVGDREVLTKVYKLWILLFVPDGENVVKYYK